MMPVAGSGTVVGTHRTKPCSTTYGKSNMPRTAYPPPRPEWVGPHGFRERRQQQGGSCRPYFRGGGSTRSTVPTGWIRKQWTVASAVSAGDQSAICWAGLMLTRLLSHQLPNPKQIRGY